VKLGEEVVLVEELEIRVWECVSEKTKRSRVENHVQVEFKGRGCDIIEV
jgi:hypothetical protein